MSELKFNLEPTDLQKSIVDDHKEIGEVKGFLYNTDGASVTAVLEDDEMVTIAPKFLKN